MLTKILTAILTAVVAFALLRFIAERAKRSRVRSHRREALKKPSTLRQDPETGVYHVDRD